MNSRKIKNLRNSFDRNIFDKQVDRVFETGRQFVDGVSGARPGKRRNSDFQGITSKSVKKVGKWVSEKVDLFFDEEANDWYGDDDWHGDDDFYDDKREIKSFNRESSSNENSQISSKRPLEALSLRKSKNFEKTDQKKLPYVKENNEDWPNEFDFKVDRWQRSPLKETNTFVEQDKQITGVSKARNLPRSRRRRV